MNTKRNYGFQKTLVFLCLVGTITPIGADTSSPLDINQHPDSPEYIPVYTGSPVPLDAQLSWTERFNGDETFNADEVLSQASIAASLPKPEMKMTNDSMMGMDGMGVIKDIRSEQGKVKIAHSPIDKYGMPAMTMMFKVEDPALLKGIEKNQHIGFVVDNSSGGFVVTQIMPMKKMKQDSSEKAHTKMDAQGEIKTIRASQGKVKIKHGPIDKYGMPAMTMMFKVADPSLLDDLKKGSAVEFDIDNSSGGFVITNIVPVSE